MALRLPGSIAEVSAQSLGGGGLIQQRVREQASALSSSTPPSSPSSAFCRPPSSSSSSCSPSSSSSASLFNHASAALHSPHRPRSQLHPSSTKLVGRMLQVSFLFGKRLAIPCCGGELYGPNRRWRVGRIARAQQSPSSSGDNLGGEKGEEEGRIAPLQPQSPEGQFLAQLLKSHPHLFATAVDQQLERLAADRDANASPSSSEQQGKKGSDASPSDLILYRRIADLKETERKTAIEEVIYCLIVQKFIESGVELLPELPVVKIRLGGKDDVSAEEAAGLMNLPVQGMVAAAMSSAVDLSPKKETLLESVHSSEALEMVREHVGMVLGARSAPQILDPNTIVQISKLRVGQVYAASIMYGYFLKRVDQRFQLEKNMRALLSSPFPSAAGGATLGGEVVVDSSGSAENEAGGNAGDSSGNSSVDGEETSGKPEDVSVSKLGQSLAAEASAAAANMSMGYRFGAAKGGGGEGASGAKPNALRAYVMSFDVETLQRNATMKSREAVSVIEKHTEALFGRPDISVVDDGSFVVVKDDNVRMNVAGLRRLVFEAVAFGSILWDVEGYVDSQYRLV